jgi:hypothetical protein
MSEFSAAEVEQASNFLFDLFSRDASSMFTAKAIERALICAALLQRGMHDLLVLEGGKVLPSNQALLHQSRKLISQILKLSKGNLDKLIQLHTDRDVNGFFRAILERQQFSADQRDELRDLL